MIDGKIVATRMEEKLPSATVKEILCLLECLKRILKLKISLNEGTKKAIIEIRAISEPLKIQQSRFNMKNSFDLISP